jgi:hypothetical protein
MTYVKLAGELSIPKYDVKPPKFRRLAWKGRLNTGFRITREDCHHRRRADRSGLPSVTGVGYAG